MGMILRVLIVAPTEFRATERFRSRWRFLFIKYRPQVWIWALPMLVKRVCLNLIPIWTQVGASQLHLICAVLAIYGFSISEFQPWRHHLCNTLDTYTCLSLVLSCSLLTWFAHRQEADLNSEDARDMQAAQV